MQHHKRIITKNLKETSEHRTHYKLIVAMINKVLVYWLLVNKNLGDKRGTHHSTPIVISNNVENFDSRLCKEENANIIVLFEMCY